MATRVPHGQSSLAGARRHAVVGNVLGRDPGRPGPTSPLRRGCSGCMLAVLLSLSGCCVGPTPCCPGAASEPKTDLPEVRVQAKQEIRTWELVHECQGGEVATRAGNLLRIAGIEYGGSGGKVFDLLVPHANAVRARRVLLADPLTRPGVIPPAATPQVPPKQEVHKWELVHESQGGEVTARAWELLRIAGIEFDAWGGKVFGIVVRHPDAARARKVLLADPMTRGDVIPPQ